VSERTNKLISAATGTTTVPAQVKPAIPGPRVIAELLRAPAALTVPGDSLAGAAAAGWPFGRATPGLAVSSVLLYWAGMALNDYADRHVDAVERPERPIPSGRVRPGFALGLAGGLTAAGLGVAGLAGGRRAMSIAVPLAATVWAYDLALKATRAGPATMATARGLDVLLGAGSGRLREAASPAAIVAAHTLAVTVLSRREVTGGDRLLPAATLAATGAIGLAAAGTPAPHGPDRTRRPEGRVARGLRQVAGAGLLGSYLTTFGRAQLAAVTDPSAERIRRAVGAGILGVMPLQASLATRAGTSSGVPPGGKAAPVTGGMAAAGMLAVAFPLARRLSRRVSPT
jgi:UbiA prenyltransferase family